LDTIAILSSDRMGGETIGRSRCPEDGRKEEALASHRV